MSQLLAETGEERFTTVVARVAGAENRLDRYIDMVEENVVREDLTFAEMAQVAIRAGEDPYVEGNAEAMVGRLYASLHKVRRSYVRQFVHLLAELGDVLPLPRDLGIEVARMLKAGQGDSARLREALAAAETEEAQARALRDFATYGAAPARPERKPEERQKLEFHVGSTKVTARQRECRIVSRTGSPAFPRSDWRRRSAPSRRRSPARGNRPVTFRGRASCVRPDGGRG